MIRSIFALPCHILAAVSLCPDIASAQSLSEQLSQLETEQKGRKIQTKNTESDTINDSKMVRLIDPIVQNGRNLSQEQISSKSALVAAGGPLDREASGSKPNKGIGVSDFELATSDNRVVANLAFGYTYNHVSEKKLADSDVDYRFKAQSIRLSAKASVPVNGKDARQFADFKRIGDDSKLTLSAVLYQSHHNDGDSNRRVKNLAYGECIIQAGRKWVAEATSGQADARLTATQLFYDKFVVLVQRDSEQTGDAAIEDSVESSPEFGPIAIAKCVPGNGTITDEYALLRRYGTGALGEHEYENYNSRFLKSNNLLFIGADLAAGYERYDILNRTTFQNEIIDRVGFDAALYAGLITADGGMSFKLSGGYARGYKTKPEAEICRATGVAGETQCLKGQDGLPTRESKAYAKGEYRIVLQRDEFGLPRIAAAPEITYDFKEKAWVFDLPIYLQRSKADGLDGGVRMGYQTADDDFGIGVFVGIPFSTWF